VSSVSWASVGLRCLKNFPSPDQVVCVLPSDLPFLSADSDVGGDRDVVWG
jgi:hypothetical protein